MAKQHKINDVFAQTSFLYGGNANYIDQLYAEYEKNPDSVDLQWRAFFENLQDNKEDVLKNAEGASWQRNHWPLKESGELVSALDGDWSALEKHLGDKLKEKAATGAAQKGETPNQQDMARAIRDSFNALMMIRAFRTRGHLLAQLDPLRLIKNPEECKELSPEAYGFSPADYERPIFIDNVLGLEYATIPQILEILKRTYCSTIGVEYMHIADPAQKAWIQERIEGSNKQSAFTQEDKKTILDKLIEAEGFEQFLDTKYKGTKRFGLDGGEALIPALEQVIKTGGNLGVQEVVFGMAHRGRLNVLSQILAKSHRAIFYEFKGGSYKPDDVAGSGDVKYHLGASTDREFNGKKIHLSLLPNPSHLEIVDPVVIGKARAKQDQLVGSTRMDVIPLAERSKVMPVLIHGDAAFAGQGVLQETFGLSGLKGYHVAGSIHVIINNQIGFTTSPNFSRSSPYSSDVAKMIDAPVFHVNGDDPEAVVFVAKVATEFRQIFHKPVIIDMVCYRRYGHNEGDEPSFTQPVMYKAIRNHQTTVQIYSDRLISEQLINSEEVEHKKKIWRDKLEVEFEASTSYKPNKADWLDGVWTGLKTANHADEQRRGITGIELKALIEIGRKLVEIPSDFHVHKTIQRFLSNRAKMFETGEGIDWATAEALAFGSLCCEGIPVRLSGEDVERGTFSQRHSVLYDQENEARYIPLNNLQKGQAIYEVVNSMLSEEAVLGFEYGYSLASPLGLTLWEAQFGDFANGAQVIFDQFISSAEHKWLRMSGLVCLLPHGFEGQGPEHSSARLERYLQLCAEDNMQVAYCTTPANYFHILRRQIKRDFRKPLILMTPKSLLRHRRAVSSLSDMGLQTNFHRLLLDDAECLRDSVIKLQKDSKIRRVVLCTGKVYYDLYEEREKRGIDDVYLLRIEQLYPFPAKTLVEVLSRFVKAEIVWCQEEPKNMGAWSFIEPYLEWVLVHIKAKYSRARYAGRPASASPATGLMSKHLEQLAAFLEDALGS
ncbi:2-oxoglutarate dehydrogenase E1 component [Bartonella bacilliformis]|uniref:2-oxoglutarate dehydrogenase E1 component n=2 Tax=Bartonella bacilliformis TaxID=774 RepID=A1UQW1_BARBK|nr:2-oxoglutarate dehydrogenase E1 component [Bartonella bacilliformis]ABM44563.1 2-oxoglutarate dehydrogenase, E1 component [Bartonella bacilliformis KC583]AMG85262.1 2-oxoglutarate dehydrogenase E1 component [Bartonella bacilliformis]EKS46596.1 2-oxoglutarate dehydrogenase E1 component [Bartonella bacilliformis INS]EYS88837.1 2-oxoglutarate dehydrogenase E1 component [Bartonella bacilliformis San Pedro600-02]KEG24705.1 2-oxoglutarate dehydrogenase E1 component [Bartonella bacilliformis Ver07